MNRRRWWMLVLLLLLVVLAGAWSEPDRRLRGWLAGEPFHQGRPASAWANAITDLSDPVRHAVAQKQLQEDSPTARAVLVHLLRHDDRPEVRWRAVWLLQQGGSRSSDALPAVLEAVEDPDRHVRRVVVRAIGAIDPSDPDAVAALLPLLDGPLQLEVLQVLSRSGPAAREGRAAVTAILRGGAEPANRIAAADALAALAGREAAADLVAALGDADPAVRLAAAAALRKVNAAGPPVVACLTGLLKESEPRFRVAVLEELGRLGSAAAAALPAVRRCEGDADSTVRHAATRARQRIRPAG